MGILMATSKKLPEFQFKDREEYIRWSLDDVSAAFHRWRSVAASSGPRITRRQFHEIFTDYTGACA